MAEQTKRTHLTDLVAARRAELHLSLDRLAERCIDPEPGSDVVVKIGWLHRLERGESVIPPQLPQLRALAEGLQLPVPALQAAAAAQFLGIEGSADPVWSSSGEGRITVAQMDQLSPRDRQILADLADSLSRRNADPTDDME